MAPLDLLSPSSSFKLPDLPLFNKNLASQPEGLAMNSISYCLVYDDTYLVLDLATSHPITLDTSRDCSYHTVLYIDL